MTGLQNKLKKSVCCHGGTAAENVGREMGEKGKMPNYYLRRLFVSICDHTIRHTTSHDFLFLETSPSLGGPEPSTNNDRYVVRVMFGKPRGILPHHMVNKEFRVIISTNNQELLLCCRIILLISLQPGILSYLTSLPALLLAAVFARVFRFQESGMSPLP